MSWYRRFQRLPNVPRQRFTDEIILFADAAGALKTVDEDGTVAPVAGPGSLPNPTNDGDVLTVVTGAWAGAPGGGSQTFKVVRVPIAYNDADIVVPDAGKEIYVPTAGEYLVAITVNVTTAWDGSGPLGGTPAGWLYSTGDTYSSDYLVNITMDTAAQSPPASGNWSHFSATDDINYAPIKAFFDDTAPLLLVVDDGEGNDPGSTQGDGEVLLFIAAA